MNHVFEALVFSPVPDGTDVSAFLNARELNQQTLPLASLGDLSIAAGHIGSHVHSWIQVHPVVTQVIYLCAGALTVRMKDPSVSEPYDLRLRPSQAAVTAPGTLFQLLNDDDASAHLLYIFSPSSLLEIEAGKVTYSDATLVARTWEDLAAPVDHASAAGLTSYEPRAIREESKRRLALKAGVRPRALADETVVPLNPNRDYLAPDGSQIRLLVPGEHGGFAHCVLPAGKISTAVRHRTVEELWYVLEGAGEVARYRDGEPARVDAVHAGDSLRIPVGTEFQFRAASGGDLTLLIATMPPWPGATEAVAVGRTLL